MASEASVADQTTTEVNLPKPEDIKEKDDEKNVEVEESSTVEAPTAEPEENKEHKEGATVIEEVKEEIADKLVSEPSAEADKNELSNEFVEPPTDVSESSVAESLVETMEEPALTEISTEEAKSVESSDVPVVPDCTLVTDGKPIEPESLVQESDNVASVTLVNDGTTEKHEDGAPTHGETEVSPQLSKEELPQNETSNSVSENLMAKVCETIESESSEATVNEPKEVVEETIVPEHSTETKEDDHNDGDSSTKESATVANLSTSVVEEVSDTIPTTEVAECPVEPTPIVEEVSDTIPTTEVAECPVEPEVGVENEKQENLIDVEKSSLTEITQTIAENEVASVSEKVEAPDVVEAIEQVKDETKEGDKLTTTETSRDIDLVGAENNNSPSENPECNPKGMDTEPKPAIKQTLLDKMVNDSAEEKKQETEQIADKTIVDTTTKEGGDTKTAEEAPKPEVPNKKSQTPGNNLISKVKKSIVKVKKAIIGKSPSLKTMTPEESTDAK
ncbi:hypothetical protein Cni_G27193 [Canna indica]|uniref:Uncharacterized protein n=1 Tax=Canna indica TaxID=4628 RepID=A0AAQ3L4H1_9LILI|nr:hypothetical protein Cni_G27193 [Canna indica]